MHHQNTISVSRQTFFTNRNPKEILQNFRKKFMSKRLTSLHYFLFQTMIPLPRKINLINYTTPERIKTEKFTKEIEKQPHKEFNIGPLKKHRYKINPLYYNQLSQNIKNLLAKRCCKSFPCSQKFREGKYYFRSRRKIYKEGCKASKSLLNRKTVLSNERVFIPKSNNFKVCTIPKVS